MATKPTIVTNDDGSVTLAGDWLETFDDELEAFGIDVETCGVVEKQTLVRQQAFLAAYAITGTIVSASKAIGITSWETVHRWRSGNVFGFRERMDKAHQAFGDHLEDIALERINDPTGNRGSDVLLMALLNANRPDKYRPNVIITDDTAKDVLKALGAKRTKRTTEDPEPETREPTPIEVVRAKAKGS